MTRRAAISTLAFSRVLPAFDESLLLRAVEPLAAGLSEGNADTFLGAIAKNTPQREQLETNVRALVQSSEITCSISVVKVDGDSGDLDWYLELRDKATQTVVERRRSILHVHVSKGKLDSIAPIEFFRAARG